MTRANEEPKAVVQSFYRILANGDVPALLALLADDLRWTEAEGFPYYAGVWRSREEVLEKLLKPLQRDWSGFAAITREVVAEGERVVALGLYTGISKSTHKVLHAPYAHVWTVKNGRLATFDMYTDTLLVARALER